ncbi:carboxyl transferase domain-containing protein [Streptomyces griseorubiginosus]|uniref:carboxyl transferase domain-containing protein n=1 Tax=Streptomyces griseorubiginosus TaxID=67304 RepID=UPI00331BF647
MPERRSAREVIALVADDFAEIPSPARRSGPDGPLAWQGYDASLARAAERTGEAESVVCGTAHVEGVRAVLIAFEFLALPGAQVGFAGSRVRPPDADPSAYTAEAQVAAGAADAVVAEEELRDTLGRWLRLLTSTSSEPAPVPAPLGATELPATGWDAVRRARSPERPRARAYLDAYFTDRVAVSGDRCGGTDPGMLCGFGERGGRTVAYAAQTGTATRPAGYRTASRLIRLADRLGIPVLTLVDTPGAANDAEAERQGAGAAIADLFVTVAAVRTPVTTLLIGEGGSGGALALAAPGNTYATPDSYFSVIAPESAAAILKRPPQEAEATADQLRIRPQDLVELGVVREPGT